MTARTILIAVSLISSGLVAGLLYGWMVSVIPGTVRTDDAVYVQTMQRINLAIINPAFLIPFLGTPVVLAIAAIASYRAGNNRRAAVIGWAAVVYAVGVIGVTVGGNIPLNDELDRFDLAGAIGDQLSTARGDYEGPWNRWHRIRTLASVITFAMTATATLLEADAA